MKIAIDLDNICINTTECVINYINERIPVKLRMSDIKTYSIEEALPSQYKWIVEAAFRDKLMWKNVEVLPRCAETLERLYNEGHELYFATASLPENLHKKINHLSRNMHFLPEGYVKKRTINICDKYLLNVDVLIDDCLDHLVHPERNYVSICLEYPWNTNYIFKSVFWRAKNWDEIYDHIHYIELWKAEKEK